MAKKLLHLLSELKKCVKSPASLWPLCSLLQIAFSGLNAMCQTAALSAARLPRLTLMPARIASPTTK